MVLYITALNYPIGKRRLLTDGLPVRKRPIFFSSHTSRWSNKKKSYQSYRSINIASWKQTYSKDAWLIEWRPVSTGRELEIRWRIDCIMMSSVDLELMDTSFWSVLQTYSGLLKNRICRSNSKSHLRYLYTSIFLIYSDTTSLQERVSEKNLTPRDKMYDLGTSQSMELFKPLQQRERRENEWLSFSARSSGIIGPIITRGH